MPISQTVIHSSSPIANGKYPVRVRDLPGHWVMYWAFNNATGAPAVILCDVITPVGAPGSVLSPGSKWYLRYFRFITDDTAAANVQMTVFGISGTSPPYTQVKGYDNGTFRATRATQAFNDPNGLVSPDVVDYGCQVAFSLGNNFQIWLALEFGLQHGANAPVSG